MFMLGVTLVAHRQQKIQLGTAMSRPEVGTVRVEKGQHLL
jgi:hypothetical protein